MSNIAITAYMILQDSYGSYKYVKKPILHCDLINIMDY